MSTSNRPVNENQVPLRLRLAEHPGRERLDGGWWPHSRDLEVELADLVARFPTQRGRVVRALFSPPDWDPAPRRVPVAGGYVKVGSFPRDDTHLIDLTMSDRTVLRLLVVPPDCTSGQGERALTASATAGAGHSVTDILGAVTGPRDDGATMRRSAARARSDSRYTAETWTDDGEPWWGSNPVAPSHRTGGRP
jgi:hypothetical protein